MTAIVGRSGSGKSSLVRLLPRLYEPTSGRVLLDGRTLDEYPLADLRRQIAWVSQDVVLFDDSVARNIAYGTVSSHGTIFVGFCASQAILAAMLESMVGLGDAPRDDLTRFTRAVSGAYYVIPSVEALAAFGDAHAVDGDG